MDVLKMIAQSDKLMSASERKVADFILHNPQQAVTMTIDQIASEVRVSTTTVNRFYKVLNVKSFSEFKIMLSSAVASSALKGKNTSEIDDIFYKDLEKSDSIDGIADKLMNNTLKAYQGTIARLESSVAENVCKTMFEANEVFIFGVGASALSAENMVQKWNRIGKRLQYSPDLNMLLTQMVTAKKPALLFLISDSGESPDLIYAAKYAKSHGIQIATLTGPSNNSLSKIGDYQLQTALTFEGEYRIAATISLSAQFFLINIIFYRYVNLFEYDSVQMLEQTHDSLSKFKKSIRIIEDKNGK
ncbi:MurR/RpiR family transcriptional regulator [Lapidilactobacillus achengensis]|uniref:MurR/RpiR family transcriptional regulator n=1 Tax=Lapidilactobacillus achengensis TaxID=2486000 RepID=A0ABW1UR44_9LACO|nr:MurR/RpiR family transcriptional regulator [Lapidilactobacillus achengensis]